MSTQPEALWMADALDHPPGAPLFTEAAELRRLHNEMLYPDRIASDLQDTCHKQAKRIAEQDALLRQALEALEGLFGVPEQWTGAGAGGVSVWRLGGSEPVRAAIAAIRLHLEGKQ